MRRRTPLTLATLGLSAFGQAAAALQFALALPNLRVPAHWQLEFIILLSLSALQSVALLFVAKSYLHVILLYGRLLVVLVASIPETKLLGIEMSLAGGLILEATAYLPPPRNLLVSGSVIALFGMSQLPLPVWNTTTAAPTPAQTVAYGAFLLTISVVGLLLRWLSDALVAERRKNEMQGESILQLTNANLGFQHYASTVSERSTEDERRRITREIHDTIGYTLTNIKMMIEAGLDSLSQGRLERLKELLVTVKEQALSGLAEARRSLRSLRSVDIDRASGTRLLYRLMGAFMNATGVRVDVNFGNILSSYGEEVDEAVYRMVQEGMTNAFRHGRATIITINFWETDGELSVVIRDNGVGAIDYSEGIGLAGMSERLKPLGGTLRAHSVVDGFELLATIPVADL